MKLFKDISILVRDWSPRDGIAVEIHRDDQLLVEIFRDDTKFKRTVTIFKKDIDHELLEECLEIFRKEIPWNFFDHKKLCDE